MDILGFLKDLFMMKSVPELAANASYGLLFVVGLLTSFHCLGMCGGVVISQTLKKVNVRLPAGSDACISNDSPTGKALSEKNNSNVNAVDMAVNGRESLILADDNGNASKGTWLMPSVLYNAGRIIAYTFVGAVVGGIGSLVSFPGAWKGLVPIFGGLFMIIMGINLLGIFPALRKLNIRMPYFAARKIRKENSYPPFFIGLLTGLMPCGPLQIVQLYALGTGSAFQGALSMFIFSLGTVPALFTLGAVNSFISQKYTRQLLKFSAVLVIFLGFIMLGRGAALAGINMPGTTLAGTSQTAASQTATSQTGTTSTEPKANTLIVADSNTAVAQLDGAVQVVTTSITEDSYPPIMVQIGVPVKWTLKATEDTFNNCNKAIDIPAFRIERDLQIGDTLVEFTPIKTGTIPYSCWMGMIKSKIFVVDDLSNVSGGMIEK